MENRLTIVKSPNRPIQLDKELLPDIIYSLELYCGLLTNGGNEDTLKDVDKLKKLILNLKEYVD
jgi:hypothetical protein